MKDVGENVAGILDALLERGFVPIHAVYVGVNGTMRFVKYTTDDNGDLVPAILAECESPELDEGSAFELPMSIMFMDINGEVECAQVSAAPEASATESRVAAEGRSERRD